jgi:hypothetical protein
MRVESLRRDIGLIGPNDRSGLRVGLEPAEVGGIPQGLEKTAVVKKVGKFHVLA